MNLDFTNREPMGDYFPYYEEDFLKLKTQNLIEDYVYMEMDNIYYVKKKSESPRSYIIVRNYYTPDKIIEYYTGRARIFTYNKKDAKLYKNREKANDICKSINRGDISIEDAEEVFYNA
jgi:hypothetical protein